MWAAVVVATTWQQSIIHTKRIYMSIQRLEFKNKILDDDNINKEEESIFCGKLEMTSGYLSEYWMIYRGPPSYDLAPLPPPPPSSFCTKFVDLLV